MATSLGGLVLMAIFRPEAVQTLKRWKEPAAIGFILLVTLRIFWSAYERSSWIMALFGVVLMVVLGSLFYVAMLRMHLRSDASGPGLVEIDERNITYLAPHLGGVISLDSIRKIDVSPTRSGRRNWVLYSYDVAPVMIPFNAEGADRLIEAFSALPGLGVERISRAVRSNTLVIETIWEKAG